MIEFKKERFGAEVATIHESSDQIVEVVRRQDGLFDLTIHNRVWDVQWEDIDAIFNGIIEKARSDD